MSIFKRLRDIVFTPKDREQLAAIYMHERCYEILLKLYDMRIAQLGEQLMNNDSLEDKGGVQEALIKERIKENEHLKDMVRKEYDLMIKQKQRQEKEKAAGVHP